jgi:hypothetical protein
MGNSTNTASKNSSSATGNKSPAWATQGTPEYGQLNSALQTVPMNAAVQSIGQGGVGAAGQSAISGLQGLATQAGQGGAADQYLTGTARGDYLQSNPYIESMVSKSADDIATQTNNMFASGGRYGSVANQGALADSVAASGNQLRNANYQAERDRQLGAANSLESAQQGRIGLQGNALTGAAGLENTGFQNMLGMISQLPTIQGNKTYDADKQLAIGSGIDARTQDALNKAIQQWSQGDMEDWARLGGLITAGMGSAGSYGTQTGTTTTPGNSMGILGLLGSVLTAPMTGGGSLIGSAFGASDRRLKENIKPVGARNGHSLYEFSYKGEPDRWIGVMADEVQQIDPAAVVEGDDGYLLVNYGRLGFPMERAD